jgi:hypothetical protein
VAVKIVIQPLSTLSEELQINWTEFQELMSTSSECFSHARTWVFLGVFSGRQDARPLRQAGTP